MLVRVLLFTLFFYFNLSLAAQGQGFSFHVYYPPEEYGVHPQNWVAEKDTNGFIYFGNGDGVLIYNGVEWAYRHVGESGRAQSIFRSSDGQVYVNGHSDFGRIVPDSLNRISYQSIADQFYNPNEPKPYIWDVYEINGLIYNRHAEGIAIYNPFKNSIRDYSPENYDGEMWASFQKGDSIIVDSDKGFWAFYDSTFSKIEEGSVFEKQRLQFAIQFDNTSYLLGSYNNASPNRESYLHIYGGNSLQPFYTEVDEYLDENWLFKGVKINDDQIALATIYGGIVFINREGKLIKIFTERTGLHSNSVYNMFLDEENILWLTLSEGIQKLDMNEFTLNFPESSGIKGVVRDIAINGEEAFIKTLDGLYQRKTLKPENVWTYESVDFDQHIDGLFTLNDKIFIYGRDGIFEVKEDDAFRQIYHGSALAVAEGKPNNRNLIFFAPGKKLSFDGNTITEEPLNIETSPRRSVIFNNELYLLVGNNELYKVNGQQVEEVPIRYDTTQSILINRLGVIDDKLYIGTEGTGENMGMFEYSESRNVFEKSSFLEDHPDFDNKQVFSFRQCSNSDVWFSVNKKLIRVTKRDNEWIPHTSPYQLAGTKSIYSMACADDGIWLGSTNNLMFIANTDWNYSVDFKTNITGIFVRNDSLIYGGYGNPQSEIILPYENNELRFTYAASSYIAPEQNTYQVKLEGFDKDWSEWTSETQKDYTNIPEGEYSFVVQARNVFGVLSESAPFSFSVLPPWYRTWWAYLLYTLAISGILYIAYKIRINQILRVQRIRNNIASDLHDEVSATLSSISYFAQAIESEKVEGDKNRFVRLIANSAGEAKEKITDIVWAINPEHDDWQDFLSKCRRFASDLLESKDMEYSLKIDEYIPGKLDMQLRQHLWLIFKEMVTNAVRHSGASQLDIIMKYEERGIKLVVQDNGKGMDVDQVKKGNGLVNINKRAELINAEISLKTSEGFGTRWMLKVPV